MKELYFIILPGGSPVSMQNFRSTVYMLYMFGHKHGLHYNVLSGLIIIIFSGLTEKIYAYALAWMKTCSPAKFQVQNCYGY